MSAAPRRPLAVAIGNPLRRDDGVGWLVADALEDGTAGGPEVLRCRELLPEHAERAAAAVRVVFVDAAVDVPPGAVRIRRVSAAARLEANAHDLAPGGLLALTGVLGGACPPAWLVTVGGADFEVGEGLSGPVSAAVPTAARVARAILLPR